MYCAGPVTTLLALCRVSQSTGSVLNYTRDEILQHFTSDKIHSDARHLPFSRCSTAQMTSPSSEKIQRVFLRKSWPPEKPEILHKRNLLCLKLFSVCCQTLPLNCSKTVIKALSFPWSTVDFSFLHIKSLMFSSGNVGPWTGISS